MALMHARTLTHQCPFCWFLRGPGKEHACDGARCFCVVVRAAVAEGSAPWMTNKGCEDYRRAFA